jgi:hypothetical protein
MEIPMSKKVTNEDIMAVLRTLSERVTFVEQAQASPARKVATTSAKKPRTKAPAVKVTLSKDGTMATVPLKPGTDFGYASHAQRALLAAAKGSTVGLKAKLVAKDTARRTATYTLVENTPPAEVKATWDARSARKAAKNAPAKDLLAGLDPATVKALKALLGA